MDRRHVLALVAAVLAGCAHKPSVTAARPNIRSIGLLPVLEPSETTFENKNGVQYLFPIAAAGFAIDSANKRREFSAKLASQEMAIGKKLTALLTEALTQAGYRVVLLDTVPRPSDDPERIELEKLRTQTDAVLQVYFEQVGLLSTRFSTDYIPTVNVHATLRVTGSEEDLYDETLYYGVDARPEGPSSIAAAPEYAYPSFEIAMLKVPAIAGALAAASDAIGQLLTSQLKVVLSDR